MLQFLRRRKRKPGSGHDAEPGRSSVVVGAGEPPIRRPPKIRLPDPEPAPPGIAPDGRLRLHLRAPANPLPPAAAHDAGLVASGAHPLDMPAFQLKIERDAPTFSRVPDPVEGVYAALRAAFTPTQPKRLVRLFTGRRAQIERIIGAIERDRAHVIVFGDRGRGKTSLANVVAHLARSGGYTVARFSCMTGVTFDDIVRGLLRDLPSNLMLGTGGDDRRAVTDPGDGCVSMLPSGPLGPRELAALPLRLRVQHLILMIDEFDRVDDPAVKSKLADSIKLMSDRSLAVTIVAIGVSDSLDHLLGEHPSIQRNLIGVPLPLMEATEIRNLVETAAQAARIPFAPAVVDAIVRVARGVPYFAQLLGLHAGQFALDRGGTTVEAADFEAAIDRVVGEADPHVVGAYEKGVGGIEGGAVRDALFALATAPADSFGAIRGERNGPPLGMPARIWDALTRDAGILRGFAGTGPARYVFVHATMPQYVVMRVGREGGRLFDLSEVA